MASLATWMVDFYGKWHLNIPYIDPMGNASSEGVFGILAGFNGGIKRSSCILSVGDNYIAGAWKGAIWGSGAFQIPSIAGERFGATSWSLSKHIFDTFWVILLGKTHVIYVFLGLPNLFEACWYKVGPVTSNSKPDKWSYFIPFTTGTRRIIPELVSD